MKHPTPIVLASSCLEHERVRYDGQSIPSKIVRDLEPFADFIRVCPEFSIGLGAPRPPIRIVKVGEEYRLIQHKTDRDVTDDMIQFSESFLAKLGPVDGLIFKSKSPTMGVRDIKVYAGMEGSPVIERCGGFFAARAERKYPGHPTEEDDRLRNPKIREHFLTQLFLFAAMRQLSPEEFLKENKLLLEFYNADLAGTLSPHNEEYREQVKRIMARPPGSQHIAEFFERLLGPNDAVEFYKKNRLSLWGLRIAATLIRPELSGSTLIFPYPEELILHADDDRDRDFWRGRA